MLGGEGDGVKAAVAEGGREITFAGARACVKRGARRECLRRGVRLRWRQVSVGIGVGLSA